MKTVCIGEVRRAGQIAHMRHVTNLYKI